MMDDRRSGDDRRLPEPAGPPNPLPMSASPMNPLPARPTSAPREAETERPWVHDAEALIMSLRSVQGVSIATAGGEITEINILADGERPPKHVARDVRSALKAELKVDVDHRKISVAQKRDETEPGGGPYGGGAQILELLSPVEPPARRVRFHGVTISLNSLRAHARVELALGDREVVGEAEGATGRQQVPRLIGEATLRAVERFLSDDYLLSLSDLEVINLGNDSVVVVNVKFITDRRQQTLSGSSVVDHDLQQSVVYATLAALNRILGRVQIKEPVEYELRPTSISHSGDLRGY